MLGSKLIPYCQYRQASEFLRYLKIVYLHLQERFTFKPTWFEKICSKSHSWYQRIMKNELISYHNLPRSLKHEKSNFQNILIVATEEKMKIFCIVILQLKILVILAQEIGTSTRKIEI